MKIQILKRLSTFIILFILLLGSPGLLADWKGHHGGNWHGHGNWNRHGNWHGSHRGGSAVFYPYYYPYSYGYPYSQPYVPPKPNDINSCPLMPSYYDPAGNWVPPTRVCPP